ncbi:hypothetical protein GVY41_13905 [Frigidibacter albus]|uniref:hypothetical protein n=1 Tax=Frigidibacter albus TaxID=1465486 RepID=UPI00136C6969|nr:hypothetical protein [Frigidibacter albus]NBE32090.1 hypothetical protein [Frigidibacter albus]
MSVIEDLHLAAKFGEGAKVCSLNGAQDVGALEGVARMVQDGDDHRHEARQHGRHRFPIRPALVAWRQRKWRAAQDVAWVGQGVVAAIARSVEGRAELDLAPQAVRRCRQLIGAEVTGFREVVERIAGIETSGEEMASQLEAGGSGPREGHTVIGDVDDIEAAFQNSGEQCREQILPFVDPIAVVKQERFRNDRRGILMSLARPMAACLGGELEVAVRIADQTRVIDPARIRIAEVAIDRVGEGVPAAPPGPAGRVRIESHDLAARAQCHTR